MFAFVSFLYLSFYFVNFFQVVFIFWSQNSKLKKIKLDIELYNVFLFFQI